jgi:Novel STAND NTPase 3
VPTGAYARAWDALKKHHFVVLDGPPEMGKSAIAWMIALTQIADGWEASACDSPDDSFRALRADSSQIFVADDAFGRTEYDPDRGMKWEAQLERVFSRLGTSHWLV